MSHLKLKKERTTELRNASLKIQKLQSTDALKQKVLLTSTLQSPYGLTDRIIYAKRELILCFTFFPYRFFYVFSALNQLPEFNLITKTGSRKTRVTSQVRCILYCGDQLQCLNLSLYSQRVVLSVQHSGTCWTASDDFNS